MSLMVCLSITLTSSSFFLSDYLTQAIIDNPNNQVQLDFALQQNNQTALMYRWKKAEKHSVIWQSLAKKLANTHGPAAYQLAQFYQTQTLKRQMINWYERSIRLNYQPAFVALSQYYFEQGDIINAEAILSRLPQVLDDEIVVEVLLLKINLAINAGNVEFVKNIIETNSDLLQNYPAGQLLLKKIAQYALLDPLLETHNNSLADVEYCPNSIQFFATTLAHLQQLEQLISGFKQSPFSSYICFAPVRYIAINALACTANSQQAIQCDELTLQDLAPSIHTRFVGLLLPQGGANVHFGILYVDAQDSLDVFIHEISHLLGFIDEYPLVANHVSCQQIQAKAFAENVAVLAHYYQGNRAEVRAEIMQQLAWRSQIKATTPILKPVNSATLANITQWQLGTPEEYVGEVGVFPAQTCAHSKVEEDNRWLAYSAFKPIAKQTKMQYFSLDFPNEYLSFLAAQAPRFLMPSFHYNLALANFQLGRLQQANFWLKQSAMKEKVKVRQDKVLQGGF